MEHPGFFMRAGPFPLSRIAEAAGAELAAGADPGRMITDVLPLSEAGPSHVSFLDNRKYLPQLQLTKAGACFILPAMASRLPAQTAGLLSKQPYHSFARALALFYPASSRPMTAEPGAPAIDSTAQLEDGVEVEPVWWSGPAP